LEHKLVEEGSWVEKGEVLAQLRSPDLEMAIEDLRGQLEGYEAQYLTMERLKINNPNEARTQLQVKESIDMLTVQLEKKQSQSERLKIKALKTGYVFAPPSRPDKSPDDRLRDWIGTPLSDRNLGAYFDESVLVCEIGDPTKFEAQLIIDQADFDYVTNAHQTIRERAKALEDEGEHPEHAQRQAKEELGINTVRIKLDALPASTLHSDVTEIAEIDYQIASKSLSNQAGGQLATVTDPETGMARPLSTSYQARALLDNATGILRNGMRGQAKIYVGTQPLAYRLWRVLARTFHFKLS
jgi:putative peptide zinc metalloprotease protein